MSAIHEHAEDRRVLHSALGQTPPVEHDDDLAAAHELLRLYGAEAA